MDIALLIWVIALTVLVIVGVIWVLDLQARILKLSHKYERLFRGVNEGGEEATTAAMLANLASRLEETTARTERLVAHAAQVDAALTRSLQGIGLVRFRAFEDTGGDQSFSLALADGEGNGVVISALYGREATRIYAKPIQKWLSSKVLTDEEAQALEEARRAVIAPAQ
ncbi:MAG: DUF4446 family protein [Anaerolineae bacterium]|nr:DUF4446 family protein [Anaerolineae bacterium]